MQPDQEKHLPAVYPQIKWSEKRGYVPNRGQAFPPYHLSPLRASHRTTIHQEFSGSTRSSQMQIRWQKHNTTTIVPWIPWTGTPQHALSGGDAQHLHLMHSTRHRKMQNTVGLPPERENRCGKHISAPNRGLDTKRGLTPNAATASPVHVVNGRLFSSSLRIRCC